jgi:hypothetical protein
MFHRSLTWVLLASFMEQGGKKFNCRLRCALQG